VPLDDVAVEAPVRPHRPLEVHERARPEPVREGRAPQRLLGHLAREAVGVDVDRGQAAAVHGDRSAGGQPLEPPSPDADTHHVALPLRGDDLARALDDAGEHPLC
jgi:hypothetical protein